MSKSQKNNVLLVCDGMNILHRGHYATPDGVNAEGIHINSIRGFVTILLADIKRVRATHCAVVFDRPGTNFRYEIYPEYKANRVVDPNEPSMYDLVPMTRKLVKGMGIRVYGKIGIEGDDMIGSLAVHGSKFAHTYISSNDKDFCSIVTPRLHLLKPKGIVLDEEGVYDTYGVWPEQMIEYLMMLGDKVDNIPGINKVGPKTAAKWLNTHGTLAKVLKREKFTQKMQKNVDAARGMFSLSRKLITLQCKLMDHLTIDDMVIRGPQPGLRKLCDELEFHSTYSSIVNTLG